MANFESGSGPLAMASATGKVKWFNATKGYGFVTLNNGSDAFCHASALAALGHTDLPQGSTIVCDLQESPRGLQVVAIHSVDTSTAEPGGGDRFGGGRFGGGRFGGGRFGGGGDDFGARRGGGGRPQRDAGPSGPMVEGTVKFFNEQKGFGFVMPEDGSGDVYLHASALRRSSIAILSPEQRIRFSTRQGMKGIEVDRIELI
jgi:CspA family cold shock protein